MNPDDNPMRHPEEQQAVGPDTPRFGRLLIILLLLVVFIAVLAVSAQTYFI